MAALGWLLNLDFAASGVAAAGTVPGPRLMVMPHPALRLVDDQYKAELAFQTWLKQATELEIIGGEGSPEGTVDARQKTLYMDVTGSAGAVLYVKQLAEIDGDSTKGWILV